MLLGLSGSQTDHDIRPAELREGAGVPHGELLVRFVDASFESEDALAAVRDTCVEILGIAMTVDVAAVVANFHMMTRIADGTGTPLDTFTEELSGELRDDLDLNGLTSTRLQSSTSGRQGR